MPRTTSSSPRKASSTSKSPKRSAGTPKSTKRAPSPGVQRTNEKVNTPKVKREIVKSETRRKSLKDSEIWTPKEYSTFEWLLRTWIGPAVLTGICPVFVNVAALAMLKADGSIYDILFNYNKFDVMLSEAFPLPNSRVMNALLMFIVFQFVLLMVLPGKRYYGPISPAGERPIHTRNGDKAFFVTFATFFVLVKQGIVDPCICYDELLPMMTCLNLSAFIASVILLFKGVYSPSTPDHGSHYPWLFRFYEGEELYPALFGIDLKNFVICRVGMMGWAIFTVSFSAASYREHNNVLTYQLMASATLNFLYVAKFFLLYEEGYMSAGDIAVDRFGFMLMWGTVAFMPLVHNLHTLHLVKHSGWSIINSPQFISIWFALGLLLIYVNYDSDTQKQYVRAMDGKCKVWGKPCEVIRAKYITADGKTHDSLLVASGYTGIVRHFHYLPDIILLFMYCSPAGFDRLLPHTYFFYLTSLLVDRCFRIDRRCATKYGKYWDEYCRRVPYRLIPGIF